MEPFNGSQLFEVELLLAFSVTTYGSHRSIIFPGLQVDPLFLP